METTLEGELRSHTETLGPPAPGILGMSPDFSVTWVSRFPFGLSWLELKVPWLYGQPRGPCSTV